MGHGDKQDEQKSKQIGQVKSEKKFGGALVVCLGLQVCVLGSRCGGRGDL